MYCSHGEIEIHVAVKPPMRIWRWLDLDNPFDANRKVCDTNLEELDVKPTTA